MVDYLTFQENLTKIRERIEGACERSGRKVQDITLLAVTKGHSVEAIRFAHEAGLKSIGENKVQEAEEKFADPRCAKMRRELIGHLQSNKVKLAVRLFDRIQSVDSEKLLEKIAKVVEKPYPVLVQVNVARDDNKFGLRSEDMGGFMEKALELPNIKLEGLMTIGTLTENERVTRGAFKKLRELRDSLEKKFKIKLPELSMGMTGDLEIGIEEGATLIRIGTALFGER